MLLEAMQHFKGARRLTLYWDIETLTYNKEEGQKQPTKYKNVTYSVAIGWADGFEIKTEVFPSFEAFFNAFFKYAKRRDTITPSRTQIDMIAHNCNKYDNHFLLYELKRLYNPSVENLFMEQAIDDNEDTLQMKQAIKRSKEENIVLEKRVKSSVNLDLTFFINKFRFNVIDNFMKTTTSIDTLGKKLKDSGFISDDELKTDFDYQAFDVYGDMTDEDAHKHALISFSQLNDEQMTYIRNDVIILGKSHIHYSEIFPGFDYSKMTFSVNILNSYLNNQLTSFQLLNKIGKYPDTIKVNYTDYEFSGRNLYEYIKYFYRGGLNFYNTKYLGQTVNQPCFSIDLNSSYPYVMYKEKIPTYLHDYQSFKEETEVTFDVWNKNYFTIFQMDKVTFNILVLWNIKSRVIRQMLVKYYNNDKFININTNTLRLLEVQTGMKFQKLPVLNYMTFECVRFGAKDIIHENYWIKSQGKLKNKLSMKTPYDYEILDEVNTHVYSKDEILLSKTILNGLYGIPALRSHFNLFRLDENKALYNIENGYKNTERNILFSTFVTSQAFFNLLEPLKYLTDKQKDNAFIYCDTDSLYLKKYVKKYIPDSIFDPIALGYWDIEHDDIKNMHVLNHKKYAYETSDGITVASAGIPNNAFNTNQSFSDFIKNEFHEGATIKNIKAIYNEQGTISIYPSETYLDIGDNYPEYFSKGLDEQRERLFERIKSELDGTEGDSVIYYESEIGNFSLSEILKPDYPLNHRHNLNQLQFIHDHIKNTV